MTLDNPNIIVRYTQAILISPNEENFVLKCILSINGGFKIRTLRGLSIKVQAF